MDPVSIPGCTLKPHTARKPKAAGKANAMAIVRCAAFGGAMLLGPFSFVPSQIAMAEPATAADHHAAPKRLPDILHLVLQFPHVLHDLVDSGEIPPPPVNYRFHGVVIVVRPDGSSHRVTVDHVVEGGASDEDAKAVFQDWLAEELRSRDRIFDSIVWSSSRRTRQDWGSYLLAHPALCLRVVQELKARGLIQ